MPRPKLHRVACDCFECEQNMPQPALSPESSAAARQDPPPKCLFIHAEPAWPSERDGTAEASTSGALDTPYLHRLAQRGCCGLVSYRESATGQTVDRLAQILLQVQQAATSSQLQVRYNHLQAGFMSASTAASLVAEKAGMALLPVWPSGTTQANNSECSSRWPSPQDLAQRAMQILGLGVSDSGQHADTPAAAHSDAGNEDDAIDLLMLHFARPSASAQAELGSCESPPAPASSKGDCSSESSPALLNEARSPSSGHQSSSGGTERSAAALLSWLNELISCLWSMPAFHQSVLLVLLLSNPCKSDIQVDASAELCFERQDFPAVTRPLQSHCISNMKPVPQSSVDSSVMVQHLPGVVRCDNVCGLSLPDIVKNGGGCCILAEHILTELAYKLGRAAKYGA